MTTVVSAPTEEILRRESLRYVGIPLPSIATSDGLSRGRIVEGEADEAWVTLVGVVLEGVVHDTTSAVRDEVVLTTTMECGDLEHRRVTEDILTRRGGDG